MRKTLFLICLFTLTLLPLTLNGNVLVPKPTGTVKIITNSHKLSEVEMEWALSVAFSPDGQMLACTWGSVVQLWNPKTKKHLRNLRDGGGNTLFSPNGQILAIEIGKNIELWNPRTGKRIRTLSGHSKSITSIAFSPDGEMLASSGYDDTILLWNPQTGKRLRSINSVECLAVAFSPNGQMLAGGNGLTIRLWDPQTGRNLRTLDNHDDTVTSIAFSPDGRTLASGSWDATVRLWNPQTGQHLKTLTPNPRQGIESIAFSPDGKMIASGGDNRLTSRLIQIWDTRTGQVLKICEGLVTPINSIAFSPDGKMLASASGQGHRVQLWMIND